MNIGNILDEKTLEQLRRLKAHLPKAERKRAKNPFRGGPLDPRKKELK
jgi:uncharacterized protein with von Willebrand factor type A (vWA) domain